MSVERVKFINFRIKGLGFKIGRFEVLGEVLEVGLENRLKS